MKLLKWLYLKLWKEPKDIKGVGWTVMFWLCALNFIVVSQVVCRSREGAVAWGGLLITKLILDQLDSKPKKLGRQLPYRRRR